MRSLAQRSAWGALALAILLAPPGRAQESKKKQTISFPEIPACTVDAAPITLVARATSGLEITYDLVDGPATLAKGVLTLTGQPGLVLVRANQQGDEIFAPAASVDRLIVVRPRPSAPVFTDSPSGGSVEIGTPLLLMAAAKGEPEPTYQWRRNGIAIVGADKPAFSIASVAKADEGSYDVVATNPLGKATSGRALVSVRKRGQMISFLPAGPLQPGQLVTLSATATSGLPVRFEVVSGSASVNGQMLTSTGGEIVVRASQDGDASYYPASATQTFVFAELGLHVP